MRSELFSERAGKSRSLSQGDFAGLIWVTIRTMRREGYFDEALDGLVTHEGVVIERPLLNAQDFVRTLKKSDIYGRLQQDRRPLVFQPSAPPSWLYAEVLFDTLEFACRGRFPVG